jgi:hypothetical protein
MTPDGRYRILLMNGRQTFRNTMGSGIRLNADTIIDR